MNVAEQIIIELKRIKLLAGAAGTYCGYDPTAIRCVDSLIAASGRLQAYVSVVQERGSSRSDTQAAEQRLKELEQARLYGHEDSGLTGSGLQQKSGLFSSDESTSGGGH